MTRRPKARRNPARAASPLELLRRAEALLGAVEAYSAAMLVVERDTASLDLLGHYWRATAGFEEAVDQWRDEARTALGAIGPKRKEPRQLAPFDPEGGP